MTKNMPQKELRLHIAMTEDERRMLEDLATYNSQSLSGLLRMLMLREHRSTFGHVKADKS